jgi:transposase-like protein
VGIPSKLTPEQRAAVAHRLAAGEGVRALAREYDINPSAISRLGVAQQSQQVRAVAQQMADAQAALAQLPPIQQYRAIDLAERLRNIGSNLASAAEYGAATSHRLAAIANAQVQRIDEADPMQSQEVLQAISALTKISNDSSQLGVSLINASNKGRQQDQREQKRGLSALNDAELEAHARRIGIA